MSPANPEEDLVERLVDALGPSLVSRGGAARDPRVDEHVSGRSIGAPLAYVRPASAEALASVVGLVRAARGHVVVVGAASTFWDGLRVDRAVVVDALALRERFEIDVEARVAHVGAGYSVRDVDRAARAHGLVVASRPDSSGETPVGSLLAVGCTAGLGMGFGSAVDQIVGATAVLGTGEVVRLGASHALHGRPFESRGVPDALGLLAASEGRGAIATDVGVRLRHAPYIAFVDAAAPDRLAHERDAVDEWLRIARRALDAGHLESFRWESGAAGPGTRHSTNVFARMWSDAGHERAGAHAGDLARELVRAGFASPRVTLETDAARRGIAPDYEAHWSLREGDMRPRLLGAAFWGSEVVVPWGARARAAIDRALELFDALGMDEPLHRRFAIYPAPHHVSVGVQVLVPKDALRVARARALVVEANRALSELGVPYRRGFSWPFQETSDAVGRASHDLLERVFLAIDPDSVIGSRSRDDDLQAREHA